MELKKIKFHISSISFILIILGILIIINYLNWKIFIRKDITRDKSYSLSKASKDIMKNLNDPVIIRAYFSKDLPVPYNTYANYVDNLLHEYSVYAKGNLTISVLEPSEDDSIKQEALRYGIPPLKFTHIEKDKYEIREGYMGLVLMFEDKKELIPLIKKTEGLEYDITSKIKKLTSSLTKSVGFLSGHGEPEMLAIMDEMKRTLSLQFSSKAVNLSHNPASLEDVDALVVFGPTEKITDEEKYHIDQFIMRGNPVAFFLDSQNVDMTTFNVSPIENNLNDMLTLYGVTVRKGMVFDLQNQTITVTTRQGYFTIQNIVNFPPFPVATAISKDNTMVKEIESLAFAFVNPLQLSNANKGINSEILVESSKKSWYVENSRVIDPLRQYQLDTEAPQGPFPLAATLHGQFTSFYKDTPESIRNSTSTVTVEPHIKESPNNRIIVVGNSVFLMQDLSNFPSNLMFFLNSIDWLIEDESLISIRSKGISYSPLKEISSFQRRLVKYLNIGFASLLLASIGVIRWNIRRISRAKIVY